MADRWHAVKEEETPSEEGPKYPIENCSDAEDAWNLRKNHDEIFISQATLNKRIKRRANRLGCDLPETAEEGSES